METKKNTKANLETKRFIFVEVGMVAALALVLIAFEAGSSEKTMSQFMTSEGEVVVEDEIPITMDTPPAPPAAPVFFSDIVEIVDDDFKVDSDFQSLDDSGIDVPIMDYIPEEVVEEEVDEAPVEFFAVEEKPMFNGGDANEFSKWVNSQLSYPEIAKENGVQGRVTLAFTVGKDGRVSNVRVLRGVDSSLDKEAVRVVSNSPKWTPGRQRDRAVPVNYTFPVIFQLR